MIFHDYQARFSAARSTKEIVEVLEEYLATFAITTFSFTYYSFYPNSLNKIKYEFSTPKFLLWHKHYIEEGYEDVDSGIDVAYQGSLPIFWEVKEQIKLAKSKREKLMREDSLKFGVEKGISIPIHGPQEDFAILLLVQMQNEQGIDKAKEHLNEFFLMAYYYFYHLKKLLLTETTFPKKSALNERELECLLLVAKQMSVQSMAKSLGITERTVNFHIQRANKKLGTKNKYLSVLKAINQGIIKL